MAYLKYLATDSNEFTPINLSGLIALTSQLCVGLRLNKIGNILVIAVNWPFLCSYVLL